VRNFHTVVFAAAGMFKELKNGGDPFPFTGSKN